MLVGIGGGTVELGFHFFVTIALVMLYQDGFPFLIAVGFVAAYAVVSAAPGVVGVLAAVETRSSPWLRAAIGELLLLAIATANLANWRLNEDSRAEAERSFRQLYEGQRAVSASSSSPSASRTSSTTSSPTSCGPRSPASSGSASCCSPATTG